VATFLLVDEIGSGLKTPSNCQRTVTNFNIVKVVSSPPRHKLKSKSQLHW